VLHTQKASVTHLCALSRLVFKMRAKATAIVSSLRMMPRGTR
jgi:hypothetical protein